MYFLLTATPVIQGTTQTASHVSADADAFSDWRLVLVLVSLTIGAANFFHARWLHNKKIRQDFELQEYKDELKTPIFESLKKFDVVAEKIMATLSANHNSQKTAEDAFPLQDELLRYAYDDLYASLRNANESRFFDGNDWTELVEGEIDKIAVGFDKLCNPANERGRQEEGGTEILDGIRETSRLLRGRLADEVQRIIDGKKANN